ncbi:MAG: transcriptional regulator [Phycisphaera sp.]|nr:transcriptional regulator [Phycisphaera sp.]
MPSISDAEWQVMQVAWERSPAATGAQEFVDALAEANRWHPRTIKTMLARLIKKGALKFEQEGNRYLYRPAVSQKQCVRAESRSFLKRVFDGDSAAALMHLVEATKLTPGQVDELKRLLEEKSK